MIHHNLKTIFLHVPRAAGTSISNILRSHPDDIQCRGYSHMTVDKAKRNFNRVWNSYYKFSVVRNPYDKVFSSWKFRNRIKEYEKEMIFDDFNEFVKFLDGYIHPKKQNILGSQFLWYGDPIELDYILPFEKLGECWYKVAEQIGIDDKLVHVNQSRRVDDKDYRKYYNEESKKIVEKYYRKDLEYFGYKY